jgi:acyl-CoA dehydrogenase
MTTLAFIVVSLAVFAALAYVSVPAWAWAAAALAFVLGLSAVAAAGPLATSVVFAVVALSAIVLAVPSLRRSLVSRRILAGFRKMLPPMSPTEADAINAGTVWWDGELFSGKPDWAKLAALPKPQLSEEEQAFVDHETEQLCAMSNDWESTHLSSDLPPHVWQYIKDKGFLGMIIPKEYGGKGFSALAHSAVVQKLSTRSSLAAISVMVPNSLGPAELLLHYGTDEQKRHYLPRLAKGQEIPAFALTNPNAGSDAASIPDYGVVCKGMWEGREVLGMRVTWDKRYITLGPICTVLGLAFRLYDPEHLLSDREDIGITCALVPTNTPGVNIGRRHLPLNGKFQNGPNSGKDVFMPLDWIIGGPKMAGQGWRMLMECLAAGRSISLPSSNVGMAKLAVRGTGGYARVRTQFKTAIGKFEGIEEPLARMGGSLYMTDAMRVMTAAAIDLGERPSVISAIAKYHATERARQSVNDAMDIQGGKGICLGPNNFIGRAYQQMPVAITVEGANILTRSLIIFGQGAIRCHPYVLKEMQAARDHDRARALVDFDRAFWGHIGFTVRNAARSLVIGLTGGRFVRVPSRFGRENHRYLRQLTRFSASFALLADVSMLTMGGALKRREKISARLGDILSYMYLASCTLKRYEDEGRQRGDKPLVDWAMQDLLHRAQQAFDGVLENFPNRFAATVLRALIFPLGHPCKEPSDRLGHRVARLLIEPSETRDRLTAGMYVPENETDIIGAIEHALQATVAAETIEARIRAAQRAQTISGRTHDELVHEAVEAGVITGQEQAQLVRAARLRDQVIRVDDFAPDFGLAEKLKTLGPPRERVAA